MSTLMTFDNILFAKEYIEKNDICKKFHEKYKGLPHINLSIDFANTSIMLQVLADVIGPLPAIVRTFISFGKFIYNNDILQFIMPYEHDVVGKTYLYDSTDKLRIPEIRFSLIYNPHISNHTDIDVTVIYNSIEHGGAD